MSMLVGVRGQTRESSEGSALREGIIQQPGPFYNGNPSSIIWGNSPSATSTTTTTTPLWREETVSPFSATTSSSSGFGISKLQQHNMHTEEKEKEHNGSSAAAAAEMVTGGEGRASSNKGRRHITRAHLARNVNPNPNLNPNPNPSPTSSPSSSPFAFGFPPQPPPSASSSASAPGFGQSRVPTATPSVSSFVAFGSGSANFAPGAFGGFGAGAIPSPQDERMEDIEEVIPSMAHLSVNSPGDSKFSVGPNADELTRRSGVASGQDDSTSWGSPESHVAAKFIALGLNNAATNTSTEPSVDHTTDATTPSGVFVFGAKPAVSKETTAAAAAADVPQKQQPPPSTDQQPVAPAAARSRQVKVKRSVPAIKGKGIAAASAVGAGNGAFFSSQQPSSPVDLHVEGSSDPLSGECSFSQPTPTTLTGFDIPSHGDNGEGCSSDDSSSQGFVSSSSMPMPVQQREDSASEGAHQGQSPSRSGGHHPNFVFGEIAKGSNSSSGDSSARSELSTVAETLLKASKMGNDISLSSAFSRVTSSGRQGVSSVDESSRSSSGRSAFNTSASVDFSDNATSKNVSSGNPEFASGGGDFEEKNRLQIDEDLSADLALKLDLGGSLASAKNASAADRSAAAIGKSGKAFSTTEAAAAAAAATGSFQKDVLGAPNFTSGDSKTGGGGGGGNQDGDHSSSSSSSPTNTVEFSRVAKEAATVDSQIPPAFRPSAQVESEPDANHAAPREPFVFGASQSQHSTSTGTSAPPLFKFAATATPSSTPPSSTVIGGGGSSKNASMSAGDLLAFKQKGSVSTTHASSSTPQAQADTDALPSSFSSFNLGASKIPVKADGANKSEGFVPPSMKQSMPTPSVTPVASGANAKEDSDDNSSYVSANSRFVFSAGSASGSPASSQGTALPPKGANAVPGLEQKFQENIFPTESNETPDFFEAQSWSLPRNASSKSFEFQASSGSVNAGSGKNATRKKSNRTRGSNPKRQSRSTGTSKEKRDADSFGNFVDMSGTAEEAGSPMDFSPQRCTPPDDTFHDIGQQTAKHAAWDHSSTMERDGLDGDDEWAQYSETDVAIENLRNAANDLTLGSKPGGRSTWEGIRKGEDDSFWWGGKENTPGHTTGRTGKWKRAVFDENQVPFSGKDNTWADIKAGAPNEPESAVSSSTPSVDSSASGSGWGPFTFTAGSSPSFSSTTSFLRRHARRIQRDRPIPGSTEGTKTASAKAQAEAISSAQTGMNVHVGGSASSAAGGSTTMRRPVFAFDSRGNPSVEPGQAISGRGPNWEQLKVPSTVFPSRSNSWSTESSMGSLPRSDGVGPISPQTAGAAATEQVCERWRLRGNQAYANGDFPKAEEYYSRGASSVPPNETSQSCIRASMLCYSNRAATRMVVGRMREALADCMRAMTVDPNFLRVRLRAANCYLALGETEPAVLAFKECIRRAKEDDQPDVKVSSEASDGLRKALQVEEYLDRASEILGNWTSGDTPTALRLLNEALISSPHSERALELKARALLILRRYEDVVQLCEQTLVTAERNHPPASGDSSIYQLLQAASGGDTAKHSGVASQLKIWRWQLSGKAKFQLGRLEEALEMLTKLDDVASTVTPDKANSTGTSPGSDPWALSIASIRDLLRHKAAGNDAFQNGKHAEAVEHYSAALACNGDSRPFNAVCFCNRAAASQALGNIGDAIADCSRAIALDPKYAKAISRRATLHEKVRDYGQSCHDLQRLITLLEGQQQQTRGTLSPSRAGRPTNNTQQDLRQARERMAKAEDEMKKGHPLDHYMILGLEPGCSPNEIKKAYRKAALRHHPDKAGQFLSRSEGGDDGGMWKEVADEVRRDAERLFKLIGEANAILSDPQKRNRYDAEEEFRKLRTRTTTATGGFSEMYRSTERGQGGAGRRPRDRYDSWSGYSHQHQRWQSGPDAAQPDTYARRGRYGSNNSSRSNGDGGRWNDYDWDDM
ncbi:unnamed protein product [Calypogeia fissa]